MLLYLIKFSGCLAIFIVFYKLFLEREIMHQIKRYFLLSALVLALGIPLITFTQYVEPVPVEIFSEPKQKFVMVTDVAETRQEVNSLPIILWTLYGFGVLIFGVKFVINLFRIINKIKHNPKCKNRPFINVLLEDLITPHTFFNYIFLNKQKFEAQQIPREVFIHEQTHAKQKHSIDVLFIELLQVVFWFNPLLYFIKKDIKLNHEFLADQAVLKNGVQPSAYQNLLLTFSLHDKQIDMANAINYSSIKKRFKVMKTHTSKRKIWLRSIVILPLIAFSIYGFSERREVIREVAPDQIIPQNNEEQKTTNPILEISFNPESFLLNGQKTSLDQLKRDFSNVTNGLKSDLDIKVNGGIQMSLINQIMDTLKGNLGKINLDEKAYIFEGNDDIKPILEVEMDPLKLYLNGKETTLENLENDFNEITKNTKSDVILRSNVLVSKSFIDKVWKLFGKNIGSIITEVGKTSVTKEGINPSQRKATPEEVAEYNKLAKHINSQNSKRYIITEKDVDRLKEIYAKMSQEQKANAEPFPNFPPAPTKSTDKAELKEVNVIRNQKSSSNGSIVEIVETEYPKPQSSLDFIVSMAKSEAKFYYKKKQITSDEAISTVKENSNLNLKRMKDNFGQQYVYLSETNFVVETIDKADQDVMVNGKKGDDGMFTFKRKDLKEIKLTVTKGEVVSFKFKIPGQPAQSVAGNTFNQASKDLIDQSLDKNSLQIFLIKNDDNLVFSPIFINIIE